MKKNDKRKTKDINSGDVLDLQLSANKLPMPEQYNEIMNGIEKIAEVLTGKIIEKRKSKDDNESTDKISAENKEKNSPAKLNNIEGTSLEEAVIYLSELDAINDTINTTLTELRKIPSHTTEGTIYKGLLDVKKFLGKDNNKAKGIIEYIMSLSKTQEELNATHELVYVVKVLDRLTREGGKDKMKKNDNSEVKEASDQTGNRKSGITMSICADNGKIKGRMIENRYGDVNGEQLGLNNLYPVIDCNLENVLENTIEDGEEKEMTQENNQELFNSVKDKYDQLVIDLVRAGLDEDSEIVRLVSKSAKYLDNGATELFKHLSKECIELMKNNDLKLKKAIEIVSDCVDIITEATKGIIIPLDTNAPLMISTVKEALVHEGFKSNNPIIQALNKARKGITKENIEHFKFNMVEAVRLLHKEDDLDDAIEVLKNVYVDVVGSEMNDEDDTIKPLNIETVKSNIYDRLYAVLNNLEVNLGVGEDAPIHQTITNTISKLEDDIPSSKMYLLAAVSEAERAGYPVNTLNQILKIYDLLPSTNINNTKNNEEVFEMKTIENNNLQALFNTNGVNLIKADNVYHAATIVNSLSNTKTKNIVLDKGNIIIPGFVITSKSDSLKDVKKVMGIGLKANINIVMDYLHIKSTKQFAKLVNYAKDNEIVINVITKQSHNIDAIEMSENVLYIRDGVSPLFVKANNMQRYRIEYCKRGSKELVPMIVSVQLKEEANIVATGK